MYWYCPWNIIIVYLVHESTEEKKKKSTGESPLLD